MERLKHVLIIVGAIILGAFVNGFILRINGTIIPLPEGVDMKTPEGLQAAMKVLKPIHFLAPFLAHAIGTFVAAYLATRFSKTKAIRIPIIIAALFFIGGLIDVLELHAPIWFSCTDLALAYFPTAFLAYKWAKRD